MASARDMLIATRPWSFQMTVISFLIGALYAVWKGFEPDPVMLTLALLGSILLHAAVNVWNDYFDYKSGVTGLAWEPRSIGPIPLSLVY